MSKHIALGWIELNDDSEWHYWSNARPIMDDYVTGKGNDMYTFQLLNVERVVLRYSSKHLYGDIFWIYTPSGIVRYKGIDTIRWQYRNTNNPESGYINDPEWNIYVTKIAEELVSEYALRKEVLGENL